MHLGNLVAIFASAAAVQATDQTTARSPVDHETPVDDPYTRSLTAIPLTTFVNRVDTVETYTASFVFNRSNVSNATISSLLSRPSIGGSNSGALNFGLFGAAIAAGAAFLL